MPHPLGAASGLRAVALLVAAEGLLLAGIAVFYVVEVVIATESDTAGALVTAALALAAGAGLLLVARGLDRGRRWSRAPALVTNLILLPVAIGLFQSHRWYLGAPLFLAASAVVLLLFTRAVNDALEDAGDDAQR